MVRHFEPQDLRGADEQRGFDPRCVGGKAAFKPTTEQMAQRPEPAQHRRHQGAYQRAVAIRQRSKVRVRRAIVELLVERPAAAQHAVEDVGGDPPRREVLVRAGQMASNPRVRVRARRFA